MANPHPVGRIKGGRPKGAINKKTQAAIAAAEKGITPLQFMLDVLHDSTKPFEDRQWAAKEAAPYIHARLTSTEQKHSGEVSIREIHNRLIDPRN